MPANAGVPLALANARLSAKSLAQARRLPWLSRPAYACAGRRVGPDRGRCPAAGAGRRHRQGRVRQPEIRRRARCRAARARARLARRRGSAGGDVRQFARGRGSAAVRALAGGGGRRRLPRGALAGGAAPSAALRRGGRAGARPWPVGFASQRMDRRSGAGRRLDRRLAGRDGAVLRHGRRRPAGRQLRAAGRAEPDRGGGLRLPGGDGTAHLQLRRGGATGAGGRRGAARGHAGRGRARRAGTGDAMPTGARPASPRPAPSPRRTGGPPTRPRDAVLALLPA